MQLLSTKTLAVVNAGLKYSHDNVQPGILHFSTGNFHRAHQCAYYDDLFEYATSKGKDSKDPLYKWGIIEASNRDGSYTDTRPHLVKQDHLFTLVETDDDTTKPQVIGSIIDMLPYAKDHKPVKEKLQDEAIKIVSMTVTEGGYFLDSSNAFDTEAEAIQYDATHPDDPQTVFGLIVQALRERRDNGKKPFTVMSCDNVPQNGAVAKKATVGLAKLMDKELAEWIEKNGAFPCSMVDRITPAVTDELKDSIDLDYKDNEPIFCEPFRQWVIEDNFCNDKPPLDLVGAQFVDDVTPWEEAKLRILNGGHASLCYPAHLLGKTFVHEAMGQDSIIRKFLDKMQKTEIVPSVPEVPNTDLGEYWKTIEKRYTNSMLSDSIARNCENGSDRQPKFILPTIRAILDEDIDACIDGLATVSAMWCKYCMGKTESGETIEPNDDMWEELHETALRAKDEDDPSIWLSMEKIYGDLGEKEAFQTAFDKAFRACMDEGVESAMKQYVDGEEY